ncbi:MAG: flotillin family protein [Myxococcales bacterium]|nr:flotillin family protein [Myxococcales bacterium]
MTNWGLGSGGSFVFASAAKTVMASMDEGEMATLILMSAVGLVCAFAILAWILKKLLLVCGPHEVLVFSGPKQQLADGTQVNYKIVQGGRGLFIPILHRISRMDMRLFPIEVTVQNAYSRDGIPLTVRAIANVKISSHPGVLRNAVERFLDLPPQQITSAAQQMLEGVLREVVSGLTPEEVNQDRLKFAEGLLENARDDMYKLGLELDVLKVQHVTDDQHYLQNLGRARIANMLRDAENAENGANQAVAEAEAVAKQAAESAAKDAETVVVQAKNLAQGELATLQAEAKEAENQAAMAAETARMLAEQQLQGLRVERERLRLHCDVVLPAEAQRKASELRAAGEAAPAIELGKANAEALKLVAAEWLKAGPAGREIYALQQLQKLAAAAAERVGNSEIASIKMVAGDDRALSAVLASYPAAVTSVMRELASALGLDLGSVLGQRGSGGSGGGGGGSGGGGGGGGTPTLRHEQARHAVTQHGREGEGGR